MAGRSVIRRDVVLSNCLRSTGSACSRPAFGRATQCGGTSARRKTGKDRSGCKGGICPIIFLPGRACETVGVGSWTDRAPCSLAIRIHIQVSPDPASGRKELFAKASAIIGAGALIMAARWSSKTENALSLCRRQPIRLAQMRWRFSLDRSARRALVP